MFSRLGNTYNLDMCFPCRGTYITRDTCLLAGGTHITRDIIIHVTDGSLQVSKKL